jgi:hypothetical protein
MNTTASTIYQQLGGSRFVAMTGAKHFVQDTDSLSFRVGRNAKGANLVLVKLDSDDTYRLGVYRSRGLNLTTLADVHGLYADQLAAAFTEATGLDTRL